MAKPIPDPRPNEKDPPLEPEIPPPPREEPILPQPAGDPPSKTPPIKACSGRQTAAFDHE